jgi:glycosyltransferase involved in cell wall biosynthesis
MARFIKARLQTSTNIETITPGIIPLEFNFDFPRENFGFSATDRLIVLSGGLLPAKNPIFAIHACERLIKDYPNLKLVMFSEPFDSNYRQKIEEEAAGRNWVNIIAKPENEILPFIYRMAEVFINVSHAEGYNPTLLEAMQCGCPILAADIHGNNAYIHNEATFPDNGSGLLYFTSPGPAGYERIHDIDDFVEKLKYLLENPDKGKELANRAAIAAKKSFSMQKELYLHLQLYKNILK